MKGDYIDASSLVKDHSFYYGDESRSDYSDLSWPDSLSCTLSTEAHATVARAVRMHDTRNNIGFICGIDFLKWTFILFLIHGS